MSAHASGHPWAERAREVRSWALFGFLVAIFLRLLLETVYGRVPADSSLGGVLDDALAVAMSGAVGVFALAQVVRLLLGGLTRVRERNERPLPAFGRWARTACEISATTILVLIVLAVLLPMTWAEWTPGGSVPGGSVPGEDNTVVSALQQGASVLLVGSLLVGGPAALLWLVAEAVVGYREPRPAVPRR
jgi:hypothetical protein